MPQNPLFKPLIFAVFGLLVLVQSLPLKVLAAGQTADASVDSLTIFVLGIFGLIFLVLFWIKFKERR
jgi:uncharacterized protein YhhL (DUF1145 family)